jgi:Heparinase II/III-like protein/Heparinase II/III N-terminus
VSATILLDRPCIRPRLDPDICAQANLNALLCGRFTVHGESHDLGDPINWLRNPSTDIEWHIVLHKFFHAPGLVQAWNDTRDARYLECCKAHVLSWIEQVEPGFIAADVTGRRIRNWVYMLSLLGDAEAEFRSAVERSLYEHVDWLADNLHPSRNHRTLELFALFIAGIWLSEQRLISFALDALTENAEADFLPDGVHVELSSHYHCLALRNLIETVELAQDNDIPVPSRLRAVIERASRFAHILHKPDGLIPMLSDADTGDYRAMLGSRPNVAAIEQFPNAGYVFLRDKAACEGDPLGSYLVLDCGDIGAGNHGHLDCLSIEFASQGRSLIVDPGRYSYNETSDPNWRAAFRRTRAHNLVQVNGLEQTAYGQGPKRMKIRGPSPSARLLSTEKCGPLHIVRAEAQSAEYPVLTQRSIIAHDNGWWLVLDSMSAQLPHHYELLFQLDPEAQSRAHFIELEDGTQALLSPNLLMIPRASAPFEMTLEQGWVAPRYGERHAAPRFAASATAANAWFSTLLLPYAGTIPTINFTATDTFVTVGDVTIEVANGPSC